MDYKIHSAHRNGFTLIEIIVVLSIITISLSLVGVLIHRSSGTLDFKTFTKDISTTLRYARNRAITEKTIYSFVIPEDKKAYGLYVDMPFNADIEEANPVIYKKIPDTTKLFFDNHAGYFRIDFFPRGNSNGGALRISNLKNKMFLITVNRVTGKVQVSETR